MKIRYAPLRQMGPIIMVKFGQRVDKEGMLEEGSFLLAPLKNFRNASLQKGIMAQNGTIFR